jgi:site-specific DNA-methyltransferase (adenine-specific)
MKTGIPANQLHQGDCVKVLSDIYPESIDLVFADPPFNIGYDYDVYDDSRSSEDYLSWSEKWIAGAYRALKPTGAFWLAIGDEYAAELKIKAQECGFICRSWVIWYYTFGVNCRRGFSRSHTHLFYFIKDEKQFTFKENNPAIRIPSARQLVYADARANPKGRLPDNTWILRPQDIPNGFPADHDTWYFPRVAGTFKEREGFHGCQMPEQLLGRIIRSCSNAGEIVLDPFGGSGTTLAVAKKLGRRWMGIELSDDYAAYINERLKKVKVGDPLNGAEDPLASAPSTRNGKQRVDSSHRREKSAKAVALNAEMESGVQAAYQKASEGRSVDFLLADPDANSQFVAECKSAKIPGRSVQWNQLLLRLRKSKKLSGASKPFRKSADQMEPYQFASEVAMTQLSVSFDYSLDEILCNPELAEEFDQLAASYAPGFTPLEYRWAAIAFRKNAKKSKDLATQFCEWEETELPQPMTIEKVKTQPECSGVYVLLGAGGLPLYVGQAKSAIKQLTAILDNEAWQNLDIESVVLIEQDKQRSGLQAILANRLDTLLNSDLIRPKLIAEAMSV